MRMASCSVQHPLLQKKIVFVKYWAENEWVNQWNCFLLFCRLIINQKNSYSPSLWDSVHSCLLQAIMADRLCTSDCHSGSSMYLAVFGSAASESSTCMVSAGSKISKQQIILLSTIGWINLYNFRPRHLIDIGLLLKKTQTGRPKLNLEMHIFL